MKRGPLLLMLTLGTFAFANACVSGTLPSENTLTVNLLNAMAGTTASGSSAAVESPGPEAVPLHYLDTIFPTTGPYALEEVERVELEANMLHRYRDGFYEPEAPVVLAKSFKEVLQQAMDEDGLTYDDIQEEFLTEARNGVRKMPDEALVGLRTMAANSIVVSEETIARPEFEEAGMDVSILERSIERMTEMRQIMIDEQLRRKEISVKADEL